LDDTKRAQHVLWLLHQLRWSDRWVFEKQSLGDDGSFPLHVALSYRCVAFTQGGLAAARELIKIILEAYPTAARFGLNGGALFPLHMAIENGWPCHDMLLLAYPESIELPDPKNGLLPFQFAASLAIQQTQLRCRVQGIVSVDNLSVEPASLDVGLNVAFELLRANPMLLQESWRDGAFSLLDTSSIEPGCGPSPCMERGNSDVQAMA
jgi:hypothetical protein